MSIEAINWALNHAPIPNDRKDASTLAITLIALANHAGPDGRDAFPSVDRMMGYTRLSRRTVQRSLRSLEELGLIRRGDTRVRNARIEQANSRPAVYNLDLSAGLSTGPDEERRADAPLTSKGCQLKRLGASVATIGGVSTTHKPSSNRPTPSAPGGRSTVPPECGQCDARPGDPISARVVWGDQDRTRSNITTPTPEPSDDDVERAVAQVETYLADQAATADSKRVRELPAEVDESHTLLGTSRRSRATAGRHRPSTAHPETSR